MAAPLTIFNVTSVGSFDSPHEHSAQLRNSGAGTTRGWAFPFRSRTSGLQGKQVKQEHALFEVTCGEKTNKMNNKK